MDLEQILAGVSEGTMSVPDAAQRLRAWGIEDLGFAQIDQDRARRTGWPEVVFGPGKSPAQLALLLTRIHSRHGFALATRVESVIVPALRDALGTAGQEATYDPLSRLFWMGGPLPSRARGRVAVCSAGTSDRAVAEEAAKTAELFGNEVERIDDIGVAGLHRALAARHRLEAAEVVIAVAGMEGALFSVVKNLISRPVIAVPTSVGGGLSGMVALFSALSSCASGVTVVGIDNGFGAGFAASVINARAGEGLKASV
ncbi:MAG: nickel pincer cofactor biosynthesis protein LarB [Myxococcota bacterium]